MITYKTTILDAPLSSSWMWFWGAGLYAAGGTKEIHRLLSEAAGPAAQRKAVSVCTANLWAGRQGLGMAEWNGCLPFSATPFFLLEPWQPF